MNAIDKVHRESIYKMEKARKYEVPVEEIRSFVENNLDNKIDNRVFRDRLITMLDDKDKVILLLICEGYKEDEIKFMVNYRRQGTISKHLQIIMEIGRKMKDAENIGYKK